MKRLILFTNLVVIAVALTGGGISKAYAITFPDMVLISGADPESVPDFYIGKYEVTYKQYTEVRANPNQGHVGDNYPVEKVSWCDAADYCNALSVEAGLAPYYDSDNGYAELGTLGYRLPTEDEFYKAAAWDPGCGGANPPYWKYSFGRDAIDGPDANWKSGDVHAFGETTTVGYYNGINKTKDGVTLTNPDTNKYGLYDMSGNVWEWNNDWYDEENRIIRGGSFNDSWVGNLASNGRFWNTPDTEYGTFGFRIARSGSIIPEPSTLLLFSPSLLALFLYARHEKRRRR